MAPDWARSIRVVGESFADPALSEVEIVERKGLGHPDTLAELVADEFVRRYAAYSGKALGCVPNVSVDKTMLVGALARLRPGSYAIERMGRALLVGKITRQVGGVEIPVEELFRESLNSVLTQADLSGLLEFLPIEVVNNDRRTDDHGREMYRPRSVHDIRPADSARWESADTACLSVEGPLTELERLVIEIEQKLTGYSFRAMNPECGTDVKVLGLRQGAMVDVTLCVPVKAEAVSTRQDYLDAVEKVRAAAQLVGERYQFLTEFHVNTKDVSGGAYLTAFGSSLDKGDQGMVGRGNGPLGVSSVERRRSMEAIAGKNPFHHPAKIYTEIARTAVAELNTYDRVPLRIAVTCRNGEPLANPSAVIVQLGSGSPDRAAIRDVVADHGADLLARLPDVSTELALRDPVAEFRGAGQRQLSMSG